MACPSEATAPTPFVDQVLAHVRRGPARLGGTRLLCIDGRSGSGKSSLAAQVHRRTGAAVVVVDDLLDGWHGGIAPAVADLVEHVLTPLSQDRPGCYRRYDWHRQRFGPPVEVGPRDLLVVEGVGAGARALDPFRTTLVWLDAPTLIRQRRALERDGESFAPYWEHWAALEERHYAEEHTAERADLVAAPTGGPHGSADSWDDPGPAP